MTDHSEYLFPRRPGGWLCLIAVLCIVAAAALGLESMNAWKDISRTRTLASQLSAPKPELPKPTRSELDMQARWMALRHEREFRWYPVFSSLEGASSEDIELLEFQPEKGSGQVTLRGEARTVEALFDYVQRLSEQPALASAVLLRQKKKQRDALTVVSFEVQATLVPNGRQKNSGL